MSEKKMRRVVRLEHPIPEPWCKHFREVLEQCHSQEQRLKNAKAEIYDANRELDFMRTHLGVLISELAKEAQLPAPLGSYRLNEDGTKIVGEVEEAHGVAGQ